MPFPFPGDLPHLRMKFSSPASPELVGGFFKRMPNPVLRERYINIWEVGNDRSYFPGSNTYNCDFKDSIEKIINAKI